MRGRERLLKERVDERQRAVAKADFGEGSAVLFPPHWMLRSAQDGFCS
jgi:hypothetical protein